MNLKDLSTKSEAELHKTLAQEREKLRDLRFKDSSRQLKNVKEIRSTKKNIARILTLLNQDK